MQVLGILEVAWGIHKTRELFEQPTFREQAQRWLLRRWTERPRYFRPTVVDAKGAIIGISGGKARVQVWNDPLPGATTEQEIDRMNKNLGLIRDDVYRLEDRMEESEEKHAAALDRERQERSRSDQETRELMAASETGGLHLSLLGAILLIEGVIMGTIPNELTFLPGMLLELVELAGS